MTSPASEPLEAYCGTCGNTREWHDTHNTLHRFNGALALPKGAEVRQVTMPFDPVLRQALITKGILTPQDLRDAEEQIRAVTAQLMGGGNDAGNSAGRA